MPVSPSLRVIQPALWARSLEMPMRILVTGASGYVGSALIPRLRSDGHHVRGYGRSAARVSGRRRRDGRGRRRARHRPRPRARRRRRRLLPDPLDGGRGAGAFADLERRTGEHFAAAAARGRAADRLPRRPAALDGRLSRHLASRLAVEELLLAAVAGVDRDARLDRHRRPLALVPLPRAPDRADAGARPARVAQQPHGAGRRARHARVPRPRRHRAEGARGPVVGHRGPRRDVLR